MTFAPATITTFPALMMGAASTTMATGATGDGLAGNAAPANVAALSSFTEPGLSPNTFRLIPVPGAFWKVAPEVDESPTIASMVHPEGIDLFRAQPAADSSETDATAAIIFAAALLMVSIAPLAMTFSMRAKQMLSDMLGIGVSRGTPPGLSKSFIAMRDSVKPSLNPVRIGGEEIPDVRVELPQSPEKRFTGGKGIS